MAALIRPAAEALPALIVLTISIAAWPDAARFFRAALVFFALRVALVATGRPGVHVYRARRAYPDALTSCLRALALRSSAESWSKRPRGR